MISENYEENGYGHDLKFLIISHQLHVTYPTRSVCKAKSICLMPAYLMCCDSSIDKELIA